MKDFIGHQNGGACLPDDPDTGLEMKPLATRQGSCASTETYASSYTHPQTSPSTNDMTPDSIRHACTPSDSPLPSYTPPNSASGGDSYGEGEHNNFPSSTTSKQGSNLSVQIMDEALPRKCKKQQSNAPKSPIRTRLKDGPAANALRQMFRNRKQPKQGVVLGKPRSHLTDAENGAQSHSSSESVNSQGSVRTPSSGAASRFRKPALFGGRSHQSSPTTGKKLANYHLIANSQSGKERHTAFAVPYHFYLTIPIISLKQYCV